MFLLYAVVIGLAIGLVAGGRAAGLARLEFRWAPLVPIGFATQLVLFSEPVSDRVGDAGPAVYVGSTVLVLLAVLRNVGLPGLPLVAVGSMSNLAAIVANDGYMPAAAAAKAALGRSAPVTYSNSAIVDAPSLAPLTDIFALPAGLPFANVFSAGDVLIGAGVVVAIVAAMRAGRPVHRGTSPWRLRRGST
jgi:hypothetical protein